MRKLLPHSEWFLKSPTNANTLDGREIETFEFKVDSSDANALTEWSRHFREHYCLDSEIDRLRRGTNKSRAEYLTDLIFPDKSDDFGPATRSGDFAEIIFSDLLEYHFGYWVPRTRYESKLVRNESPRGTDILGFYFAESDINKASEKDVLIAFESKAQASGVVLHPRLQEAVTDSRKDVFRIAEALNAAKRRLLARNDEDGADRVERFQDGIGRPFVRKSGAGAVLCSSLYSEALVSSTTDCAGHENAKQLLLVVIHASTLMKLVHSLYERSAREA